MTFINSSVISVQDRDDEMAAQMNIAGDDLHSSMKITLAPSETKPMTR